jgi:hypothetical protein
VKAIGGKADTLWVFVRRLRRSDSDDGRACERSDARGDSLLLSSFYTLLRESNPVKAIGGKLSILNDDPFLGWSLLGWSAVDCGGAIATTDERASEAMHSATPSFFRSSAKLRGSRHNSFECAKKSNGKKTIVFLCTLK